MLARPLCLAERERPREALLCLLNPAQPFYEYFAPNPQQFPDSAHISPVRSPRVRNIVNNIKRL